MRAPSAASPAAMPARKVPTAAMAATPSARQARTMRKDRTPPRNSRRASLKPSAILLPDAQSSLRIPESEVMPGGGDPRPGRCVMPLNARRRTR